MVVKALLLLLCLGLLRAQNLGTEVLEDPPKLPLYMGRSYNLLEGNPMTDHVDPGFMHEIFDWTFNKKITTEDGKYMLPDKVGHRKVSSCAFSTDTNTFRGTTTYQNELRTKAEVSAGYKGLLFSASFSSSFSYQDMEKKTIQSNRSHTHATAECEAYEVSVDLFDVSNLLPNFVKGAIQCTQTNNWSEFIDQFGTHFAYEVILGGRATQEISYTYEAVSKLSSLNIDLNIAAKAQFAGFFADASFDWHKHKEEIDYTSKLSESRNEIYIGGEPPRNGDIHTWVANVLNNPMPIRYKLHDLSELFKFINETGFNATKAASSFYAGLDAYCKVKNCKAPTPDKPKPSPATSELFYTGGYGNANGGNPFDSAYKSTTLDLVKVLIRSGSSIDNIQFLLGDGVKEIYTSAYGGQGGAASSWAVPTNEFVTQLEIWYDNQVNGITFITNKGNKSKLFGRAGGHYSLVNLPTGRIVGIFGRAGSLINQIGLVMAKTNIPHAPTPDERTEVETETIMYDLLQQ